MNAAWIDGWTVGGWAVVSWDLATWAPSLAVLGLFVGIAPSLPKTRDWARTLIAGVLALIALRYLSWRLSDTVLAFDGTAVETAWIWAVYAVELVAFIEVAVFLLIMSRAERGPGRADAAEAALAARGTYPSVDVLIPTYNEGLEVLEKAIVGAQAMSYPNYRVHVLDDGRRDWLAAFCRERGVSYIARADNAHAKAGNMNHALAHTDGDLVAVFDADFVPHRTFLARTAGLFETPDVGIVQTPQHFFNKDPVQLNLQVANDLPDEQRLFFDQMAASRDAWGVAFCCGSCSVMRRSALQAIGGVPTASITEDLLTTLSMRRAGYRTVYLNEKLSQGLAAESLDAFFVQRARWARGGIQTIFLKEGPLGPGLSWLERLLFFPWSWVVQYAVRMAALLVPAVYLWTGLVPLYLDTLGDLLFFQLPTLLAYLLGMRWFVGRTYVPLVSTAVGTFGTFRLLPTVLSSLVKPFGAPFRVTPKGALNKAGVDWGTFAGIMAVAGLTAGGLAINAIPGRGLLADGQIFPVAAAWGLLNLVVLLVSALICFDAPRRRKEERFRLDAPVELAVQDDTARPARILPETRLRDLSVTGARIGLPAGTRVSNGDRVTLRLEAFDGFLAARVVRGGSGEATLAFVAMPAATRDRLIAFLFAGRLKPDAARRRSHGGVWQGLWRRLTGPALA